MGSAPRPGAAANSCGNPRRQAFTPAPLVIVMTEDTWMNELATTHHLVLYTALIIVAMATLEWFESRRARVRGGRGRRRDRARQH